MREVRFRGKRVDNGEWVYGNRVTYDSYAYILAEFEIHKYVLDGKQLSSLQTIEVVPETVGQWTGLYDKNGLRIFDGDIVGEDHWGRGVFDSLYEVVFRDGCFGMIERIEWLAIDGDTGIDEVYHAFYDNEREERFETERRVEVLGNKFDNPELMKR